MVGIHRQTHWKTLPVLPFLLAALLVSLAACRPRPNLPGAIQGAGFSDTTKQTASNPVASDTNSAIDEVLRTHLPLEHISMDDGLSSDTIYSVYQDSLGFVWIGSYNGLNRFDGYSVRVFRNDPLDETSLTSGLVYEIFEDSQGNLWVGTYGGGLDRLDRSNESFIHYRHEAGNARSLGSDLVYDILEDQAGVLWAGTYGGGISRYDPKTESFTNYLHDEDNPSSLSNNMVYALYEDAQQNLWIATEGGLNVLDPQRQQFHAYQHDADDPTSLGSNTVSSITGDGDGGLWLGTASGVEHFDPASSTFLHYPHDPENPHSISHPVVISLALDQRGRLWAGTNGGGLNLYDPRLDGFHRFTTEQGNASSLQSDYVNEIFEDPAGTIWLATLNHASKFDQERSKFQSNPYNFDEPALSGTGFYFSLALDAHRNLWIGSEYGLWKTSPGRGEIAHFSHDAENTSSLSSDWVFAILNDSQGVLWIGTSAGIDRLNISDNSFTHYRISSEKTTNWRVNTIQSIVESADGDLWFATAAGMRQFDRDKNEFVHYFISTEELDQRSKDQVNSISEDLQGVFWVGTEQHGILQFDRQTGAFLNIPADTGFPDYLLAGSVTTFIDSRGKLWAGTEGHGVTMIDPLDGSFQTFTRGDGLASDFVVNIFEDGFGTIWVINDQGISRLDASSPVVSFTNFDLTTQSGKDPRVFMGVVRGKDEVLLAAERGLISFNPGEIRKNPNAPKLALVSLRAGSGDGEVVLAPEVLPEITLSWPENNFDFEFVALNYTHPVKNQYAYMLEGYDEGWNTAGNRRYGRYTNLPGGSYLLRLTGSNNEGVWNEEGLSIPVTIIPPFWQTLWFQTLAGGIVVALIISAFLMRTRSLANYQHKLELEVQNRTNELVVLNTIAGVISSTLDEGEILCGALEKTLEILGISTGGIYLFNKGSGLLDLAAAMGLSTEMIEKMSGLAPGEGYCGEVYSRKEALIVPDLIADGRETREDLLSHKYHSLAVTPLVSRGVVLGSFFVATQDPDHFADDELRLLDAISNQIAIGIENARHYASEHFRAEQFQVIVEVGRRLTVMLDEEEILRQVVALIQKSFGYYHVAVGLVEEDELVYKFGAGELWDDPDFELRPSRLIVGKEGLGGWVAAVGQPILVPDVSVESRYVWMEGSATRSELIVPVFSKNQVMGVLDAQSDKLNAFDDTDLVVLQSLANITGAAIETARLYAQSQMLAVIEERGRLARELHDAVTQTLFSASLLAEALPVAYEKNPNNGKKLLQDLRSMSRGALAEMRTLLLELRPSALAQTSLRDLLTQLCEAASGREGIPVNLLIEGSGSLPEEVHIACYRIAQEALNNIVKHARANRVEMKLRYSQAGDAEESNKQDARDLTVSLEIVDDGRGFLPGNAVPKNMGLRIMSERSLAIHADLLVESEPGTGTRILLEWNSKTALESYPGEG